MEVAASLNRKLSSWSRSWLFYWRHDPAS